MYICLKHGRCRQNRRGKARCRSQARNGRRASQAVLNLNKIDIYAHCSSLGGLADQFAISREPAAGRPQKQGFLPNSPDLTPKSSTNVLQRDEFERELTCAHRMSLPDIAPSRLAISDKRIGLSDHSVVYAGVLDGDRPVACKVGAGIRNSRISGISHALRWLQPHSRGIMEMYSSIC